MSQETGATIPNLSIACCHHLMARGNKQRKGYVSCVPTNQPPFSFGYFFSPSYSSGFGLTVVGVGKGVTVGRGGRVGRWVGLVEGKVGLTVSGIVGTTGCSVFGNVVELVEGTVGISVIGAVGV